MLEASAPTVPNRHDDLLLDLFPSLSRNPRTADCASLPSLQAILRQDQAWFGARVQRRDDCDELNQETAVFTWCLHGVTSGCRTVLGDQLDGSTDEKEIHPSPTYSALGSGRCTLRIYWAQPFTDDS